MDTNNKKGSGIGRGALHLTLAKIMTILMSLVSSMLLSRFRTVEEYGTYNQLTIAITLAASLFMLGLPNSINYFLAKADTPKERKDFISVYYSLNTALGVVFGVALVLATPLVELYFNNPAISEFMYFLALYPWAYVTISGISNLLVVYDKTKKLMLVNVITAAVSLLSVLVIQLLGLSFKEYITAFLVGNMAIAVWIYIMSARLEGGMRPSFKGKIIKQILVYSVPIGLASLVGTVNIELDKLMIGNQLGTEALAYYANAGKELPLTMVAASLTAVLMPQLVRKLKVDDKAGVVTLWGRSVELSYILICFFATACVVFAPQIMTILYSEKYLPGVDVFRIYSLVLILRVTYFGMVLNCIGKTKFIFWSSIASLVLNVVLNYLMYLAFGFIGPAIATLLSILTVNLIQLVLTARELGVPFSGIFPWRRLLKISLVNISWGVVCYVALCMLDMGVGTTHVIICIAIGILITVLYCLFFLRSLKRLWKELNEDDGARKEETI